MKKMIISGIDESAIRTDLELGNIDNIVKLETKHSFSFASARDAGQSQTLEDVSDQDVMLMEFENGIRLWTRVDQFKEDFPGYDSRDQDNDGFEIPRKLDLGGRNRGVTDWVLKTLNIFGINPVSATTKGVIQLVEKQLADSPGLYQCVSGTTSQNSDQKGLVLKPIKTKPDPSQPILVFVHGTASSSAGSFGELWQPEASEYLGQLQGYFGTQIYALEHRTLSESPVQNAIDLCKALHDLCADTSQPLQIHLVSHSRGGLVSELLARVDVGIDEQPISDQDIESYLLVGKGTKKSAQDLKKLNKLLDTRLQDGKQRRFTIHRFVRTACPARGTTLASERLDRWLSISMNLMGQIPFLKASSVFDAFSSLTLAVVKQRTDPKEIPGLAAQMPGSPLIRMLNLTNTLVDGDLSVISGDIEPDSFWGKLKVLIPDLYYRDDHDLVVDTRSMTGGTRRTENRARNFFDQGPGVNHFQYFSNERTADMLVKGLLRSDQDFAGFTPIHEPGRLMQVRAAKTTGDQPIVLLLPGILGSHLQVNSNRVWLDLVDLAFGGMERLAIDANNISAESLVGLAYNDLIDFLAKGHDVVPFPYDWRLSIETEAKRFGKLLEDKLQQAEQSKKPLHIIAHSMGGLVSRMAFALKPDLWDRMVAAQGRFLMLGTPTNGSHVIARLLMGREQLLKYLDLVDITNDQTELLAIISRFPGVLQLLPHGHGSLPLLKAESWGSLAEADAGPWLKPDPGLLDQAQQFWNTLNNFKLNHENMLYIAGKAPSTPVDLEIVNDSNQATIRFYETPNGDGRVTWESGIPASVRSWYVNTGHGNLADYRDAFGAYVDLLSGGDSSNPVLSTEPIRDREAVSPRSVMVAQDHIDLFPDETLMIDSFMGYQRSGNLQQVAQQPLKVIIAQGDLCYASNSLALGHYHDDLLISAESYVNKLFDGRLRQRMSLGLYPGPLNTVEVVYNPKPNPAKPEAVLIVGLGAMGNLTRGSLTETFSHAALQYAISIMEKHSQRQELAKSEKQLKLSSLLIGSGAGGISIEDSLLAMIQGLLNANQQLETLKCCGYHFVELEFLERWEDIANAAAHALGVIAEDSVLKTSITYTPALNHLNNKRTPGAKVHRIEGARNRVTFEEAEGWWRRIQIHHIESDNSLRFNTLTNKARTEITLQAVDLAQVNTFIEQSIQSTYDNPELSKTLFEMLLPHSLKEQTQNNKDLVLVLNEKAARYPWELLQDRWANHNQDISGQEILPISVEFGMIRQLESEVFRTASPMHGTNALVIGNPLGDPDIFPDLPGAEKEAKSVYRMLSSKNYQVHTVFGKNPLHDAQQVILGLHADSYRIMHFAGHGVYEHTQQDDGIVCDLCGQSLNHSKKITGMVIGKNAYLTPANIKSIRFVPDLVFINCCHLGREEGHQRLRNPHQLAANLATEFIRMGVKAVIATGWAVDDRAAETFAHHFYNLMLNGQRFGDAVRKARFACYTQHPGSNTWGAYQCYGNPDFQLFLQHNLHNNRQTDESVSESELAAKIDNIGWDAKISGANIEALQKELDSLVDNIPESWMNQQVQESLAAAYSELGMPEQAVFHYQTVKNDSSGQISFQTIEQLANQQARLAVDLWREQADQSEVRQLINDAIDNLEKLQAFGETCDRLCGLGRIYKAKAIVSTRKKERQNALKDMQRCYQQASKIKPGDSYPLFSYLTAGIINNWSKETNDETIIELIKNLPVPDSANGTGGDFWKLVETADFQLLKHLNQDQLAANKKDIIENYLSAKRRAGSPMQLNSITGHLQFLLQMAKVQMKAGESKNETVATLTEILEALI